MRHRILFIIALLSVSSSFGQKEFTASKTDEHKQVAGTKCFLIPPAEFNAATNFQGFQQGSSGASILVMEIPAPIVKSIEGFTTENLKRQGVNVLKKETIKVNGLQGLLFTTEQSAYGIDYKKYITAFGDSTTTVIINWTFPKELPELEKDILESMNSLVYESELIVDPFDGVSFTLNTENTKLKFGKSISGGLAYTVDGKVPTEDKNMTLFIAAPSFGNVPVDDMKQAAIDRVKKMPYTDITIDESKTAVVEIDGIQGYEIVATGLDKKGNRSLIYQVMLFSDNGYYLLVGTTEGDVEENLILFKKVARTFKRK